MQLARQPVPEVGDHGCDPKSRAFAGPAAMLPLWAAQSHLTLVMQGRARGMKERVRPPSAHAEVVKPCVYPLFSRLKFCVRMFRDAPAPGRELHWGSQHQAGSSVTPKCVLGDAPAPST